VIRRVFGRRPLERLPERREGPKPASISTRLSKVLAGTGWLVADSIVSLAVPFLLTPVMLDHLGEERFGFYVLIIAFVGYLVTLDLGLSVTLSRNIALYAAQGRWHAVRQLMTIGVTSYLVLGLFLSPLLIWLDDAIIAALDLSTDLRSDAFHVLWWSYALIFLSLSTSTFRSLLIGLQRMRAIALSDTVAQLAFAVSVVWLLSASKGLDGILIASYLRVVLLALVLGATSLRHVRPMFSITVERSVLQGVLSFSGWMQVNNLCALVSLEIDRLLIGAFVSVRSVSHYEVANRLATIVRVFPLQFLAALLPAATEIHAEGDESRLNKVYAHATRLVALLTFGLAGLLIGAATPLFEIWLGRTVPDATNILVLLIVAFCVNNMTGVGTILVRAIGKPRYESQYAILSTVSNVVLTVALAPTYGLYGIVAGTVISTVLGSVYFLVTFHRLRALPWRTTLLAPLARLLVAVVFAAGTLHIVAASIPPAQFDDRLTAMPILAGLAVSYVVLLLVASRVIGFLTAEDLATARRLLARKHAHTVQR
jgi:O-antigen/teichoic acid export membrane protein